jgi:hypothetical protein
VEPEAASMKPNSGDLITFLANKVLMIGFDTFITAICGQANPIRPSGLAKEDQLSIVVFISRTHEK